MMTRVDARPLPVLVLLVLLVLLVPVLVLLSRPLRYARHECLLLMRLSAVVLSFAFCAMARLGNGELFEF